MTRVCSLSFNFSVILTHISLAYSCVTFVFQCPLCEGNFVPTCCRFRRDRYVCDRGEWPRKTGSAEK